MLVWTVSLITWMAVQKFIPGVSSPGGPFSNPNYLATVLLTCHIDGSDLKLSLAGSGDMNLKVSTKNLTSKIAGSGNISLNGNTDEFSCSIAGSGNINGYDLKAAVTNAKIAGSGNVEVNAVSEIHASIAGSGNVYYTGNPEVEKSNAVGSGSLKKKS